MDSQLPRERVWACEMVARFGTATDVDRVRKRIEDPDGHVRQAAATALVTIGGKPPASA